jgi:glycosyltransferase involved in cell wall biosynthesis
MVVIPNGVEVAKFADSSPDPAYAERFPEGWFHIGTVGRFHEVKNHAMLLEAARMARERGLQWRVHFAGDGELRAEHEAFVRQHDLADHVVFHGNLSHVERFYPWLDLFALTSRSEGHPNALLEAIASGIPAVSTPVGDVPHYIRDGQNGFIVPQNDAQALFTIIQRAAADRDRLRRIAAAGQSDTRANYDLDVMIGRYADLYRELAGVPTAAIARNR